jgi:hypothetical protein
VCHIYEATGIIPTAPHIRDEAEDYGGVYNFRKKRGGTSYSLHAYGAAIDLDADDNSFRAAWPVAADMPLEIIEVQSGSYLGEDDIVRFEDTYGRK